MTLASSLVRRALLIAGVVQAGEPLDADEAQDGLDVLNDLIEAWRLNELLVYARTRQLFALTANVGTYTIGSGGTFNTTRPVRIEQAGFVDTSQTPSLETPLTILTDEQYDSIALKGLTSSWSTWLYYDRAYPLGQVILWPAPTDSSKSVRLYLWQPLSSIATLETDVDLPPGYRRALQYNLAREIAPEYGLRLVEGDEILRLATESKRDVETQNSQAPIMHLDPVLYNGLPYGYNYRTDNY